MPVRESNRPITSLLTEVISELAYLIQTEIRLARAEISEKLSSAASSGALIGAGGVLALSGFLVLLFAAVKFLAIAGLPEQWGFLLVGAIVAVVGGVLVMKGVNALKASSLYPKKTVEQVRADYSVIKEQVK